MDSIDSVTSPKYLLTLHSPKHYYMSFGLMFYLGRTTATQNYDDIWMFGNISQNFERNAWVVKWKLEERIRAGERWKKKSTK